MLKSEVPLCPSAGFLESEQVPRRDHHINRLGQPEITGDLGAQLRRDRAKCEHFATEAVTAPEERITTVAYQADPEWKGQRVSRCCSQHSRCNLQPATEAETQLLLRRLLKTDAATALRTPGPGRVPPRRHPNHAAHLALQSQLPVHFSGYLAASVRFAGRCVVGGQRGLCRSNSALCACRLSAAFCPDQERAIQVKS